jgi:hypothetical protein
MIVIEVPPPSRRAVACDPLIHEEQQRAPRSGSVAHGLNQLFSPSVVAAEVLNSLFGIRSACGLCSQPPLSDGVGGPSSCPSWISQNICADLISAMTPLLGQFRLATTDLTRSIVADVLSDGVDGRSEGAV